MMHVVRRHPLVGVDRIDGRERLHLRRRQAPQRPLDLVVRPRADHGHAGRSQRRGVVASGGVDRVHVEFRRCRPAVDLQVEIDHVAVATVEVKAVWRLGEIAHVEGGEGKGDGDRLVMGREVAEHIGDAHLVASQPQVLALHAQGRVLGQSQAARTLHRLGVIGQRRRSH